MKWSAAQLTGARRVRRRFPISPTRGSDHLVVAARPSTPTESVQPSSSPRGVAPTPPSTRGDDDTLSLAAAAHRYAGALQFNTLKLDALELKLMQRGDLETAKEVGEILRETRKRAEGSR